MNINFQSGVIKTKGGLNDFWYPSMGSPKTRNHFVQGWTKILEFLYCGYGTVINLLGEGYLKNGGWGYGGVWRGCDLILQVSLRPR
jgi:hypothetical protein